MSSILLQPCGHILNAFQCAQSVEESSLSIRVNASAQDVFAQVNTQLGISRFTCAICNATPREVVRHDLTYFPLSTALFSKVEIEPFAVQLRNPAVEDQIHFRRVELHNIEHRGEFATDGGTTYERLSEIANDFKGLTSMMGPGLGRVFYAMPTSWKAKVYIQGIKKSIAKGLPTCDWILSNGQGKTIGNINLTKIDKDRFELEGELADLNLYNIGVLLHSDFQRRGVVTAVTNHFMEEFKRLMVDIDGLWIMTRPGNDAVNYIARSLNFTFIKQMDVPNEGMLPCVKSTFIPCNIYIKRIH